MKRHINNTFFTLIHCYTVQSEKENLFKWYRKGKLYEQGIIRIWRDTLFGPIFGPIYGPHDWFFIASNNFGSQRMQNYRGLYNLSECDIDDRYFMLVSNSWCWPCLITNISKLSPTHFFSNIRHQHQSSHS